jgi:hypothetical protein
MIRSALVFLALAGCATAVGCNKQKAGTAESTTEPAKAAAPSPPAIVPNVEPTSVPNEPPPAELNDESAGVKDPPDEEPGDDPKGEDDDDDNYE